MQQRSIVWPCVKRSIILTINNVTLKEKIRKVKLIKIHMDSEHMSDLCVFTSSRNKARQTETQSRCYS